MGALNGAQAEFYRLVVAPYEDRARRKETAADPFHKLAPYAEGIFDHCLLDDDPDA